MGPGDELRRRRAAPPGGIRRPPAGVRPPGTARRPRPALPDGGGGGFFRLLLPALLAVALLAGALPAAGSDPPAASNGRRSPGAARDTVAEGTSLVTTTPFPIRAAPGLERMAWALARDSQVVAPLPAIGPPLALPGEPPTLYLVHDLGAAPGRREAPREWVAGFADFSRNLMAVRASTGEGGLAATKRVLRHELAHVALHRVAGPAAPRWLHEGYAQMASGGWEAGQAWRIRFVLLKEGSDVLRSLRLGFPGGELPARTAYLLSYTAVQELVRAGGMAGFRSFLERLGAGDDTDAAMRAVYGITLEQFERRWRDSVTSRYGWLYFLSRASVFWLVLTVAVVLLGWRRWRYQKRRWEELRQRERAEAGGRDRFEEAARDADTLTEPEGRSIVDRP